MAVTASATIVAALSPDIARPGYAGATNMGWNNRVGDPSWIADFDYYRRAQLVCTGNAGEDTRIVNWECYDDTVPFKSASDITAATAGDVASPYGAVINHTGTWTVWATTGVATADAPKYRDTGTKAFSRLRANGQRVQVLLGDRKKVSDPATTWTIAAYLPGGGRVPSAFTTFVVTPPTISVMPLAAPSLLRAGEEEGAALLEDGDEELLEDGEDESTDEGTDEWPDNAWTKADIVGWLDEQGVDPGSGLTKAELLELVETYGQELGDG